MFLRLVWGGWENPDLGMVGFGEVKGRGGREDDVN